MDNNRAQSIEQGGSVGIHRKVNSQATAKPPGITCRIKELAKGYQ